MALIVSMLLLPLLLLQFLPAAEAQTPPRRPIAIRLSGDLASDPDLGRYASMVRRYGLEMDIGPEEKAVPAGWSVRRVSVFPVSERFRSLLERFPIRLKEKGFVFDGRAYRSPRDGIKLFGPERPQETLILGNSPEAALRLLRWGFRRDTSGAGYVVASGDLSKQGRFESTGGALAIVRSSDRDEIATREAFTRSLKTERPDGIAWRFRESERGALPKWQSVLRRFSKADGKNLAPLTVVLFPDPATKGLYTGSSRPADLVSDGGGLRVEVDISAPPEPDLISPVLAAAALSRETPRLASRPAIALAAGARAFGRWWGRDVRSLAAFLHRAQVEPSVVEVLSPRETKWGRARGVDVSPIFAAGAAASWLDAGARSEGELAVERALAGDDRKLAAALSRWRKLAIGQPLTPARRRAMPPGFLRGVSYAMSNSAEASYASPRSLATLSGMRKMSVSSISVMPYAFSQDASSPEIAFVHLHPAGETDEGTVRAVSDARSLGMTAMVKPQIWLGGGEFVGAVAMRGEEDWRRWFDGYRRFVVHNAVVAEASGAALFCVGTELVGTEARERQWRQTIAAVRWPRARRSSTRRTGRRPRSRSLSGTRSTRLVRTSTIRSPRTPPRRTRSFARAPAARPNRCRGSRDNSASPSSSPRRATPRFKPHGPRLTRGRARSPMPPKTRRARSPRSSRPSRGRTGGKGSTGGRSSPTATRGTPGRATSTFSRCRRARRSRRASSAWPCGRAAPEGHRVSTLVETAVEAARAGGEVLLANWRRLPQGSVSEKKKNDFVTHADRESEEEIVARIRERFPGDSFLGEEGGRRGGGSPEGDGRTWIIDPLDGTSNFIAGFPFWCVSVAARERGEIVAGVVWDPLREEIYTATRGGGAFRDGVRLAVSDRAALDDAFLATGFPFRSKDRIDLYLALFHDVFLRARAIRRAGSAALDLANVASGVFDGFFEFRLSVWDIAAGALLIEEAGGRVTDYGGGARHWERGNVVAGTKGVVEGILEVAARHFSEEEI